MVDITRTARREGLAITAQGHLFAIPSAETAVALRRRIDGLLDLALEDTFPASDPISTMHSMGASFPGRSHS